jgi:hypothetical protein
VLAPQAGTAASPIVADGTHRPGRSRGRAAARTKRHLLSGATVTRPDAASAASRWRCGSLIAPGHALDRQPSSAIVVTNC